MNERIKELAIEAGFYANPEVEKFAELIMKECIDAAFRNGDNIDYIRDHFGV